MNHNTVRWGLLGAGNILNRWMKGALQPEGMEIAAVASRTRETAARMAEKWSIPRVMSYEEMIASDGIDVVYIPVPHQAHKELAVRAMNAGKHVLVEKPAAVSAAEWAEMSACAKKNGVFLMEAFWTRFFPATEYLLRTIADGAIGEVRFVQANFSFRSHAAGTSRLTDPAQAGGGLLDVGVYNLHFAHMIYGRPPVNIRGTATIGQELPDVRVDEMAAYVAQYDRGELAVMASGIRTSLLDTATVYGTEGYIVVPHYWKPTAVTVVRGGREETREFPVPQRLAGMTDEGFQFEVAHVNECLRAGLTEPPVHTHAITAAVLEQCDSLRRDWGLIYPFETNL